VFRFEAAAPVCYVPSVARGTLSPHPLIPSSPHPIIPSSPRPVIPVVLLLAATLPVTPTPRWQWEDLSPWGPKIEYDHIWTHCRWEWGDLSPWGPKQTAALSPVEVNVSPWGGGVGLGG
jgi:hypothetical protein